MKKQILVSLLIASSIVYAQKEPLSLKKQCIKKIVDKNLSYDSLPAEIQEPIDFEKNKRILKPHLEQRALKLLKPSIDTFQSIPGFDLENYKKNAIKNAVKTETQLALRNKKNDLLIGSGHWYDGGSLFQITTPNHTRYIYVHSSYPDIDDVIVLFPECEQQTRVYLEMLEQDNLIAELIITQYENGNCWLEANSYAQHMRKRLSELDALTERILKKEANTKD